MEIPILDGIFKIKANVNKANEVLNKFAKDIQQTAASMQEKGEIEERDPSIELEILKKMQRTKADSNTFPMKQNIKAMYEGLE